MPATSERWLLEVLTRVVATATLALGIGVLLGGPDRFSNSSFVVMRSVPGQEMSWGFAFAIAGTGALAGSVLGTTWITRAALSVTSALYAVLAVTFVSALLRIPEAAITAPVVYSLAAVVAGVLAGGQNRDSHHR